MQAERAAREKEEEDGFRRQTMERFAEQDRVEQMNAQKRRVKVAQHAREVERLIQEKREMYEAAMVSLITEILTLMQFMYMCLADCHVVHAVPAVQSTVPSIDA